METERVGPIIKKIYDFSKIKTGDLVLVGESRKTALIKKIKLNDPQSDSFINPSPDEFGFHGKGNRGVGRVSKKAFHDGPDGVKLWSIVFEDVNKIEEFEESEELKTWREEETESSITTLDVPIINNINDIWEALDEVIESYKEIIDVRLGGCKLSKCHCVDATCGLSSFDIFIKYLERRYKQAIERPEIQKSEILEIKKDAEQIIEVLRSEYKDTITMPVNGRIYPYDIHYNRCTYTPYTNDDDKCWILNNFPDNHDPRLFEITEKLYPLEDFLKKLTSLDLNDEKEETEPNQENLKLELEEIEKLESEYMGIYKLIKEIEPKLVVINNRIIYLNFILNIRRNGGNGYLEEGENKKIHDLYPANELPSIEDLEDHIKELKCEPCYEKESDNPFWRHYKRYKLSFKERKELEALLDPSYRENDYFDPEDSMLGFFYIGGSLLRKIDDIKEYKDKLSMYKLAPKKPETFGIKHIGARVVVRNPTKSQKDIQKIIDKHKDLSDFYRVVETIKEYYEWIEKRKSELFILVSVPDEILKKVHECIRVIKK